MKKNLTPIQTLYNGFPFRSRTEARHARFMDVLKVRYEYELEGFEIDGVRYLPDFYLPELGCYIEVKGDEPTKEEEQKARLLSRDSGKRVLISISSPWYDQKISGYFLGIKTDCIRFPWAWYVCSNCKRAGLIDKMMYKVSSEDSIVSACYCEQGKPMLKHSLLDEAFEEARQARFEAQYPLVTGSH